MGCPCVKPAEPSLFRKYKVDLSEKGTLGQGTFAIVYKARNKATHQDVAVKIIDKANSRRDLLNTEIWILQNFGNHAHIVNLYDLYETNDEVHLVIELMLGGELFDLLDENGPYGEKEAAIYLKSIASGLAYLHAGNVAHRDLKPENLLLTSKGPKGVLKISDFGLAKILMDDEPMKVACGTWIYCAPEVLHLKQTKTGKYCMKCDVFSVGCILFIMMSGYHPFDIDGNDDEELMQECILADTWDFEDAAWHGVSEDAKDLIENMLMWEPKERLSAAQLLAHHWTNGLPKKETPQDTKPRTSFRKVEPDAMQRVRLSLKHKQDEEKRLGLLEATGELAAAIAEVPAPANPSPSEGTGGSISVDIPNPCEIDAGTGGGTGGAPLVPPGGTGGALLAPPKAMPPRTGSRKGSPRGVVGPGGVQMPPGYTGERRISLNSQGKRAMPKKHVPRAGSMERVPEEAAAAVGLELKGAGATFDAKANEVRWEKYYQKKVADEKSPDAPQEGNSADADAKTADPGPNLLVTVTAPKDDEKVAKDPADPGKKAAPKNSPAVGKAKKQSLAKPAAGNTRQFGSIKEWKEKQAPKLLKEGTDDANAEKPRSSIAQAKGKAKAKGKPKAKAKPSPVAEETEAADGVTPEAGATA